MIVTKEKRREYNSTHYYSHQTEILQQKRDDYAVRGEEIKERRNHYGGKCVCCGEDNYKFLVIDHINGGGRKHRKQIGSGGYALIHWLDKNNYPEGFQVLCHNCNAAKAHYGSCPHFTNIIGGTGR